MRDHYFSSLTIFREIEMNLCEIKRLSLGR